MGENKKNMYDYALRESTNFYDISLPPIRQPTPIKKKVEVGAAKMSKTLANYSIGEMIGKGGFGSVYKGLNSLTGHVVAIKRVEIQGVDTEKLMEIQMEVDLLKNLSHPNIVQYIETIRDSDFLHIVLEFMENGSLSDIMKKFDNFPETLASFYIAQVLQGLDYLHKQGVIHRDIKGANILTTKDGCVKLADFGVAMKLSDTESPENSVVGTPYWMAPEIIEMSPPTPACDIWSVGCTVVELLGGKPPYFDLPAMSALFRIVQDDHPPLPSGISESATDFLLQCFKKEPSFRKGADELLKHPWIRGSNKDTTKASSPSKTTASTATMATIPPPTVTSAASGKSNQETVVVKGVKGVTPPPPFSHVEDDDGDWGADFDEGVSAPPVLQLPGAGLRRPSAAEIEIGKQIRALEGVSVLGAPSVDGGLVSQLAGSLDPADVDAIFWDDDESSKTTSMPKKAVDTKKATLIGKKNDLSKFADKDDDVWDGADFADLSLPGSKEKGAEDPLVAKLRRQMSSTQFLESDATLTLTKGALVFGDDGGDLWDGEFEEIDFEEDPMRDQVAKQAAEIMRLIRLLKPQERDSVILNACKKLIVIFQENPAHRQHFITHHGVIPIMEMLEVSSPEVIQAVLQVVNEIIRNDVKFQENLSLVGLIPIMMKFASSNQTHPIRVEAAMFVRQICATSKMTLQMFISCGGLPILVGLLDPPYDTNQELLNTAIEGIFRVFSLNTVQNDFCRLFAKFNLLPRLINVLQFCCSVDTSPNAATNTQRIANIFLVFATNGDQIVKEAMSDIAVLRGIIRLLKTKPERADQQAEYQKLVITLLKCIRNLSMASSCLDNLDQAGTIAALVPFLVSDKASQETKNTVLHTMFYLCLVNRERQEQAVLVGIIPYLQSVARTKSPLKQFALPIYCDLAHSSNITRAELKKHKGVEFYLELLNENYWSTYVVKCLAVWLSHDMPHVESVLLKPANFTLLINVFQSSRKDKFENLLEPFLDMISKSVNLNRALARSSLFVMEIIERIKYPKAIVRKNLLNMLKQLFDKHDNKRQFVLVYNLYPVVQNLAADNVMILVKEISSKLLKDIDAVFGKV
jgi:serine/threonine protein kinase